MGYLFLEDIYIEPPKADTDEVEKTISMAFMITCLLICFVSLTIMFLIWVYEKCNSGNESTSSGELKDSPKPNENQAPPSYKDLFAKEIEAEPPKYEEIV